MVGGMWNLFLVAAVVLFGQNRSFCWCKNRQGLALLRFKERVVSDPFGALSGWGYGEGNDLEPCAWFGVECSDGKVVLLNLRDLCLRGIIAPEIGYLSHINSIILRNNSFLGNIPKEIGELKDLTVLDLGYNNFSGPCPSNLGNNPSISLLLLDNNKFLHSISPEVNELNKVSEHQVDEEQLVNSASRIGCNHWSNSRNIIRPGDSQRRLLKVADAPEPHKHHKHKQHKRKRFRSKYVSPSSVPSPSPSPSELSAPSRSSILPPIFAPIVQGSPPVPSTLPKLNPGQIPSPLTLISIGEKGSRSNKHNVLIWSGAVACIVLLSISAIGLLMCQRGNVVTVKPWVAGLSGQLQKALVTGVQSLERSELERACEDFSNIIGTLSDGIVYKGTLSTGVEIAVKSTSVMSAEDWSENLEAGFRTKISMLSRVNHKNFVSLIGYCEEDNPFTRMMVFEYAPNGTLFEHLHVKEAEHLDWVTRLRIAMGIAYCLEHMHLLKPPISHSNLRSSSIFLTEDYAAKVSDFSFLNELIASKMESTTMGASEAQPSDPRCDVFSFGVILFEIITGRIPYTDDNGTYMDLVSNFLTSQESFRDMVDPTLKNFREADVGKLFEVVKKCVHSDKKLRPTMKEVTASLKEITSMGPDAATPKNSPLWWAELEILSTDLN